MVDLAQIAAAFGERLHAAGIPITPERSARFAQAVALVEPSTLPSLYWTGRVALLSGQHQQDTYDRIFAEVFRGILDLPAVVVPLTPPPPPDAHLSEPEQPGQPRSDATTSTAAGLSDVAGSLSPPSDGDAEAALAAVSVEERLSERDFGACTPEELAVISALVARLPMVPPRRRARRRRRHRSGRHLDLRATLRTAYRTGGDPVRPVTRRRTDRPRRVVLIADVSGSMEPYSRVYLHLMRGAVRALHAETFVFATRLTRLTRVLAQGNPDAAYRAVARAAPDWSGGTRIGQSLMEFLDQHGRRGVARGSVVVIVSDGWEIDDPQTLGSAMQRLSRLAYHVIWVNPRSARAGFAPLTGGMSAALPYVDTFVSGHSVRAVDEVLTAIASAVRSPARAPTGSPAGSA
jgi:uncharacterized protein with von Willebrand factor type A (vWA) domain